MTMETYLTITCCAGWEAALCVVRRPDNEGKDYSEEVRDNIFIGIEEDIELSNVFIEDMPNRECDGFLYTDNNLAWIITEEEWNRYLDLEKERANSQREEEYEI